MTPRVLITGGEGDLAGALREAFERNGASVSAPGRAELDVTSAASVGDWFQRADPPDLLIANAGRAESALLSRTTPEAWDRQLEVNLHGAFRCLRAAAERLQAAGRGGHLVVVSSHAARHPAIGQLAYATAKAGLEGLVHALARELGDAGIRVNGVLPGFLDTRMTAGVSAAHRRSVLAGHCLGRFNTTRATADFLLHLHFGLPHTSGQMFQLDSRCG